MVKGISRRVVVVESPDQRFFEQAIFLIREDALGKEGVTDEQILRVDGLMVEGQDAGGKDTAGSFQVAVAIVNSDDLRVLELFHNVPLFRLFVEKRKDRP